MANSFGHWNFRLSRYDVQELTRKCVIREENLTNAQNRTAHLLQNVSLCDLSSKWSRPYLPVTLYLKARQEVGLDLFK